MGGPAPTYRPTFPPEFLEQVNELVHQRTVRSQLRQRARLVLLFHHQPLVSNTAAAACVDLHPNSVRLWRRRWASGHFVLEDESGRGPQPRFSPCGSRGGQSARVRSGLRDRRAVESPSAGGRYKYGSFPRDPQCAEKAAVVRDLYAGLWQGQPLGPKDHSVSADEQTSIQARLRCHPTLGPAPGRPRRVECEDDRGGALQ